MSDVEGFDPSELRVNFTDKEAASKALEPLPSGTYDVFITDVEPRQCGPDSKNPGKWYYALEFTVDGGPYDGRKTWTNAMLFPGALYTISQAMKAIGLPEPKPGEETNLPGPEDLRGKPVTVVCALGKAQIGDGTKEAPQYPAKVEVKGIKARGDSKVAAAKGGKGGKGSLLPG